MVHVDDGVGVGDAVDVEVEGGPGVRSEGHEQGEMHDVVDVMGYDAQYVGALALGGLSDGSDKVQVLVTVGVDEMWKLAIDVGVEEAPE